MSVRTIRTRALKALGACASATALSLALAGGTAWAADVIPTQTNLAGSSGEAIVNVLDFSGTAGETVFITVQRGDQVVTKLMPHRIGDTDSGAVADGQSSADLFAVQAASADDLQAMLNEGLTVSVYSDRLGKTQLYAGTVHAVYADLGEAGKQLIGTHTGNVAFSAPESLFVGGQSYKLSGDSVKSDDADLAFAYEAYEQSTTVDGSIRYVIVAGEGSGQALSTYTPIPGLEKDKPQTVAIPEVVEDGGKVYRTLYFESSVTANNPTATSFTVPVMQLGDAQQKAMGYYLAVINMVDGESGEAIATDRVYVKGDVTYTAPSTIYKNQGAGADALTYDIAEGQEQVIAFSAANDAALVVDGTRTVNVSYQLLAQGEREVPVTFVLNDGTKREGDPARQIGTVTQTVNAESATATPPKTYSANGTTYEIVGNEASYAYTYGNVGQTPVVDVYYLPEGYSNVLEDYTVTVNYVDFYGRGNIDSETFTSSADSLEDIVFNPPAELALNGTTYKRLPGQESISHNYYSQFATYTIYYYDVARGLEAVPTIQNIRVVYRDGGTTTTPATTARPATATTAATPTAGSATTSAQLNTGQTYNVAQGAGSTPTATTQSGRDALQQRIEDDETALASGKDEKPAADEPQQPGLPIPAIIGGAVAAIVIAALAVFLVALRRRRLYPKP